MRRRGLKTAEASPQALGLQGLVQKFNYKCTKLWLRYTTADSALLACPRCAVEVK